MQFFSYPCLIDFYLPAQSSQDPITFEIVTTYDVEPLTVPCNFRAVHPQANLEEFGERYQEKELVLVEIRPKDGDQIDLSCQAAGLRHRTKHIYYYPGSVFNVSNISPVTDFRGHPISIQVYCELAQEKRVNPEELTP